MSTRAQLLVSHPPLGPFDPDCSSPTQLCLFERNRPSPASTKSLRARLLVSHHQALSSPATCLPPTVSIRAQPLVSCLGQVPSSPIARLPPPPGPFEPGYLSPTQPCQSERNCSSPASTRPFRARLLVSHPTVSIRAQPLVSRLHQVPSSPIARLPPPPDPFEPGYLSPTQPCQSERNCSCPTRSLCLLERNRSPVIPWQLACCSAIRNLRTFL